MDDRVKVGLAVVDGDGKRLGKVTRLDPWGFEVVRRFWGPSQWVIRWDEVLGVRDGAVRVARSDDELLVLAEGGLPEPWMRKTPPLVAPAPAPPSGIAPAGGPAPHTYATGRTEPEGAAGRNQLGFPTVAFKGGGT